MKDSTINQYTVFDGQVFQSTAWDRGMGKYSLSLLSALFRDKNFDKSRTRIIFSRDLELSQEASDAIKKLCPGIQFDFVQIKTPKIIPGEDIRTIQAMNKKTLRKYIDDLHLDAVPNFIILSLLIDQYISVFPDNTRKILLFYDLIPLQYSDRYGKMWSYPNYLRRFSTIFEADRIMTISQTVADDLGLYTGISEESIKSIDGGPIERKHLVAKNPKINIPKNFILMPSGNDLRKNNYKAIQGFEEFRISSGNKDYALVVTSHFDKKTVTELSQLSQNIIFTGNVSESELKWLYENSKALLFVPEYEGLGLPILEAVDAEKPIVCSNLTVFNEMSEDAFYYVDQKHPSSISKGLSAAVDAVGIEEKTGLYEHIRKKYTWSKTASKAVRIINAASKSGAEALIDKPKLAVFTPSPRGYSAIGKVVMLSHHSLSQYFDVDYYIEEGKSDNAFTRQSFLDSVAPVYPASQFNTIDYSKYDAVIYHIGNSEYHLNSIKNALHLPGYLVIHDTKLKEAFEDVLVRYAYMDPKRMEAERELDSIIESTKTSYLTSLIHGSLGLVVHSSFAEKSIIDTGLMHKTLIKKLELPVSTPSLKKLKISPRFSIGFGGIIHKSKGLSIIDQIINLPDFHNVDLHIFGVPLVEPGTLERLEAYPNVKIDKNLTDFEFENRLSEMDAIVSYRPNYNGETSLTVIEGLRHGVVPIVRDIGWFSELPNDAVEKVGSEDQVIDSLKRLMTDSKYLNSKKNAAKKLAKDKYVYKMYAQGLNTLINSSHKDINTMPGPYKFADLLKSKQPKETLINFLKNPH